MAVNVQSQQALKVGDEPVSPRFERLRAHAEALRTEGLDEVQFHRFIQLAKREAARPTPELAELVDGLLADERLTELTIGETRVRAKLLEVQQALGFPWALEIDPADLALLARPPEHLGFRWVTGLVAFGSALFNGMFAAVMLHEAPISFFFAVGFLHALFVLAGTATFRSRGLLRTLGWMWLCGPAFTVGMTLSSSGSDRALIPPLGMVMAIPAMLTAWLALGLSGKAPK